MDLRYLLPIPILASLAIACSDATTGKRVTLRTAAMADTDLTQPATNAVGWSIALDRVTIASGAMYYFSGPPLVARSKPSPSILDVLMDVKTAHAHPGHYTEGEALGQMLEPATFTLSRAENALPGGAGVSGTYRSAQLSFDERAQNVIVVEGRGTKGSESRAFRFTAAPRHVLDTAGKPVIHGCVFHETRVEGDGTVQVHVRPNVWFDQVELDDVPPGAAPVDVPESTRAFRAFERGIKNANAFVFTFSATSRIP
jgi:hypothetical protein